MEDNFEMGDNLVNLANAAKQWFIDNSVEVPKTAKEWQKCAVSRKEVPPGFTTGTLTRKGINVSDFIAEILDTNSARLNTSPITKDNCLQYTGLIYKSHEVVTGHKRILTECSKCHIEEVLDYGTLQRMRQSDNMFCRYCRNAGGKVKSVERYNKSEATAISNDGKGHITYKCNTCSNTFIRGTAHASNTDYVVCNTCFPDLIIGTRVGNEYGKFDSMIEFIIYKKLLSYFSASDITRQVSYDTLFQTGTKHTADFYIPKHNLVLEATTISNGIGDRYTKTKEWKLSVSKNIHFVHSGAEVDDIVRPLLKGIVG